MRLLVVSVALVGGCSLFVPIDDVTGGADPADAATDGAPGDADAATASDADATATVPDADAGPVFTCPTGALLCDDLERAAIETGPWVLFPGSSMGTISTKYAKSPTRSATVVYDPAKFGPIYDKTLDPGPGHLVVSFDVLVEKAVAGGYVEIFKTPFGPVNNWDAFALSLDATGMTLSGDRYDGNPSPAVIETQVVATNAQLVGTGFHHMYPLLEEATFRRRIGGRILGA